MEQVALITGGTKGIGFGLVRALLAKGCRIATCYHSDTAAAEATQALFQTNGREHLLQKLDLADLSAIPPFVNDVVSMFGRIDYLVNNVGTDENADIVDISLPMWLHSQNIMLNAPFVLCQSVVPIMRNNGFGRVVNLGASSKDYLKGVANLAPFGINKAALTVLTKTLALEEIAHGITVNMVAPGSTKDAGIFTEEEKIPLHKIPLGRRVTIDEVVQGILFFLDERNGAVTGQCLGINGGLST